MQAEAREVAEKVGVDTGHSGDSMHSPAAAHQQAQLSLRRAPGGCVHSAQANSRATSSMDRAPPRPPAWSLDLRAAVEAQPMANERLWLHMQRVGQAWHGRDPTCGQSVFVGGWVGAHMLSCFMFI